MGYGKFSDHAYASYTAASADKPRAMLFARSHKDAPTRSGQEVNVEKIGFRESRDSEEHTVTTPVIVGLDVSGSMGMIAEYLAKQGLGPLMGQLLQRRPVASAHLMFMAIGDAIYDRQPLQATQFESDNKIVDQLTDLYLEGGGGGNSFESYDLAWAFAAHRTKTDAWEKRQAKGYLFTIGDECYPMETSRDYLRKIFGPDCPQDPTPDSLLAAAQERYQVFHLLIEQGNFCQQGGLQRASSSWKQRLQRRVLSVRDYKLSAEIMVTAIAIAEGNDLEDVLGWWPQDVRETIRYAFAE